MAKKVNNPIQHSIAKKVTKVKEYHVTMTFYDDGTIGYKRENINFSVIELIGVLTQSLNYLCNLIECEKQPDEVKSNDVNLIDK